MQYTIIQVQPEDAKDAINLMAKEGWRVISQSESKWQIVDCCGYDKEIDSVLNIIMGREEK